jgi:hypothetical protein
MYGYVRTHAPELKVREQEYYRAVYCGLCRTMGKCTGQCSRMTLSYDFTFFALIRMALTGNRPTVKPRRCLAHPTRKRPMAEPSEDLALCACMSAILAYHKIRDDLRDERGLKRTAATVISPFVGSFRRRAVKRGYTEADRAVDTAMRRLCELEAARPPSVDEPATLFGELMATLLGYGLSGNQAKLARTIGLHVGRWVYILDAIDDYAEDRKTGRYNPLACLYGDPAMTTLPTEKRESLKIALLNELSELERAFDLLATADHPDLAGILSNILYMGMPREAERVLFGEQIRAESDSV